MEICKNSALNVFVKMRQKGGPGVPPDRVGRSRPMGPVTNLRIAGFGEVSRRRRAMSSDRASSRIMTRASNEVGEYKIPPDLADVAPPDRAAAR